MFFDLEPGVIGAVCASPLGELSCPGNLENQNAGAGNNRAKGHLQGLGKNSDESPCSGAALVVNS